MDDEVDSITYIQKTIILLSNEIVEKRGELDNVGFHKIFFFFIIFYFE